MVPGPILSDPVSRRRRRRRRILLSLALLLLITTYSFRRPLFHGNFGVVERERVFRSAQPEAGLAETIRTNHLASILNLRGGSTADKFYANEVRVTKELGVEFYDFPMSATRRPTRRELLVLIDLLGRCRYPLLIHCKSGSDRTGLATALYLMVGRGVGPKTASRAFTLDYGHVALNGTQRLHEPLDEYATWLITEQLAHTPERLRSWVETRYESPDPSAAYRPLRPGPRESLAEKSAHDPQRSPLR